MGTLDPQGEGVLPIGVGKATRLFDLLLKKDKIYEAKFDFGYETDTLDKEFRVKKKLLLFYLRLSVKSSKCPQNTVPKTLAEYVRTIWRAAVLILSLNRRRSKYILSI